MNQTTQLQRVHAIDGFRALTMFLMLFVNDIPGIRDIPHWLHHAGWDEDMLGFSDTVFPAFLFAVGLSIPFAIQKRREKGDSLLRICLHIAERVIALLVMGLFMVNLDNFDSEACLMSRPCYSISMVVAIFLLWNAYPRTGTTCRKFLYLGLRILGAGIFLFLFLIYRGQDGAPFGIHWWGILGLIGWTYLVCTLIYLLVRNSLNGISIAWLIVVALAVATHAGIFYIPVVPSDMTLHALGVSGMLTSVLMQHLATKESPGRFLIVLCGLGICMLILFFVSHPFWIISKIQATPTWLFICTAIYFPLFGLFYWLMDVKDWRKPFWLIKPAGTATLTCYIVPYLWYSVQWMLGWWYPEFLGVGAGGLIRSLLFALVIVQLVRLLSKISIRLKI